MDQNQGRAFPRCATGPGEFKDSLILMAGQRYPVRLEVMQDGSGALASQRQCCGTGQETACRGVYCDD